MAKRNQHTAQLALKVGIGVLALGAFMALAGPSVADDVVPCSVDSVPIQIMQDQKVLVDTKGPEIQVSLGPTLDTPDTITTVSAAEIYDYSPGFTAFVAAVTEHIVGKLAPKGGGCLETIEGPKLSLLQFVSLPLREQVGKPTLGRAVGGMAPFYPAHNNGCRLFSPWIDIAIEWKPVPRVWAFVRYSEPQLLADQAVLAGAPKSALLGIARPFMENEIMQYASKYEKAMRFVGDREKLIDEGNLPPDLAWLFPRAWQVEMFRSSAEGAAHAAMEASLTSYTKIVTAMIDRCLAGEGMDIQYHSILDVDDPILLEQYKIKIMSIHY